MAQTCVAACVSLIIGWIGFGMVLQHAPADAGTEPYTLVDHS